MMLDDYAREPRTRRERTYIFKPLIVAPTSNPARKTPCNLSQGHRHLGLDPNDLFGSMRPRAHLSLVDNIMIPA